MATNFPKNLLGALPRIRRDRPRDVDVARYLVDTGQPLSWAGDEQAPYVKVLDQAGVVQDVTPDPTIPGDPVKLFVDPEGRQVTTMDELIAGEDPAGNVMTVAQEPLGQITGHAAGFYTTGSYLNNQTGTAFASSGTVKLFPGRLFTIHGLNTSGGTRFLQFFNNPVILTALSVPTLQIQLANNEDRFISYIPWGVVFTNGIYWRSSTTSTVYTAPAGTTDLYVECLYV